MSFIESHIDACVTSRRNFLLASAAGLATVPYAGMVRAQGQGAAPAIISIYRNRSNPYWNAIASGGEAFAESIGVDKSDPIHPVDEGPSEKSLTKTSGNLALANDADDGSNGRPIVEAVAASGGYVCTIWNKTDDLHPWDFGDNGDNYVAPATRSSVEPTADASWIVFEAMGGKGPVVGLGGSPSNPPAIQRRQGTMNALKNYPEIELLDYRPANWNTQKAAEVMSSSIAPHGEIDGAICASDTMAFEALEALRAKGLAGETHVGGHDGTAQSVDPIRKGEMAVTVDTDPYWAGGVLLSLAYRAATGAFKPSEEPQAHRAFYGPSIEIGAADAAEVKANDIDSKPTYGRTDFWGPTTGPVTY